MGLIRTILAITVVFAHLPTSQYVFVGGMRAVQLFYIISGFLIAHVISMNDSYRSSWKFYLNRMLRIFPIFYVVALLTLLVNVLINQNFFELYKSIPMSADALLVFSNLVIFGQDWVMFTAVHDNQLVATENFRLSEFPLHSGLLVPQAWTLGVELCFYLVAPFILRDKRLIFSLLIISLSVKGYLFSIGLGNNDPWNYRFFPAELSFFLLGALSNQYLLPLWKNTRTLVGFNIQKLGTSFLIFLIGSYYLIPVNENLKALLLFSIFIVILPFSFLHQGHSQIDRSIGELSYPIYICHLLVIRVMNEVVSKFNIVNNNLIIACGSLLTTLMVAYLLNEYVGKRVERVRMNIRNSKVITN